MLTTRQTSLFLQTWWHIVLYYHLLCQDQRNNTLRLQNTPVLVLRKVHESIIFHYIAIIQERAKKLPPSHLQSMVKDDIKLL